MSTMSLLLLIELVVCGIILFFILVKFSVRAKSDSAEKKLKRHIKKLQNEQQSKQHNDKIDKK